MEDPAIGLKYLASPRANECARSDDINVEDPSDVKSAMATRSQADKGLVIIPYARGSSLDPSADQIDVITAKMGIDATVSLLKPRASFERMKIPGGGKIRLEDYIEKNARTLLFQVSG